MYPHEIIEDMRDWVKDCAWADISDDSDVDDLTDKEIVRGVEKYYGGGVAGFLAAR